MCSSYFLHGHTLYAIHVFCGCVSFPLRKSELHQSLSEPSVHEAFLWNQGAHWTQCFQYHSAVLCHSHNRKMENPHIFACLSMHGRESGMQFSIHSIGPQMAWPHAEPCFDLQQQGMEWSSLGPSPSEAPVDPSERLCSPQPRRRGTDLLFRGYSLPAD